MISSLRPQHIDWFDWFYWVVTDKCPFSQNFAKRCPHNAGRTDSASYPVCNGFKPSIFMTSCMVCVPVRGGPTSKSLNASTIRVQRNHDASLRPATPMAGTRELGQMDKSRGFGLWNLRAFLGWSSQTRTMKNRTITMQMTSPFRWLDCHTMARTFSPIKTMPNSLREDKLILPKPFPLTVNPLEILSGSWKVCSHFSTVKSWSWGQLIALKNWWQCGQWCSFFCSGCCNGAPGPIECVQVCLRVWTFASHVSRMEPHWKMEKHKNTRRELEP